MCTEIDMLFLHTSCLSTKLSLNDINHEYHLQPTNYFLGAKVYLQYQDDNNFNIQCMGVKSYGK